MEILIMGTINFVFDVSFFYWFVVVCVKYKESIYQQRNNLTAITEITKQFPISECNEKQVERLKLEDNFYSDLSMFN